MNPIAADSSEGIFLLALRAGPMTSSEISERWPTKSLPIRKLINAGLVEDSGGEYRLTIAGRQACPLRNPLAAPGMVRPIAIFKPETDMSRNIVTRQQVLEVIKQTGKEGIAKVDLVAKFEDQIPEAAITSHLVMLKKDGAIINPSRGVWVATDAGNMPPAKVVINDQGKQYHATRENVMAWLEKQPSWKAAIPSAIAQAIGCTEDSTRKVLLGLFAGLSIHRIKIDGDFGYFIGERLKQTEAVAQEEIKVEEAINPAPTLADVNLGLITDFVQAIAPQPIIPAPGDAEQILPGGELAIPSKAQVADLASLLQPIVVEDLTLNDPGEVEFAIFSSGGMDIYSGENVVTLSKDVLGKMRKFLSLFEESA